MTPSLFLAMAAGRKKMKVTSSQLPNQLRTCAAKRKTLVKDDTLDA